MSLEDFDQEAKEFEFIEQEGVPEGKHQVFIQKFELEKTESSQEEVLKFTLIKLDPHPEGKQWKPIYQNFLVRETTSQFIYRWIDGCDCGYDRKKQGLSALRHGSERMKFIDCQLLVQTKNRTYKNNAGEEKTGTNVRINKKLKLPDFKKLKAAAMQGREKKEDKNSKVPF